MKTTRRAASLIFALFGAALLHCGGATVTGDGGGVPPGPPEVHRPTAPTCSMDRASGITDAGANARDSGYPGSCNVDADCTQGKNGRCGYGRGGPTCTYDGCFTDGECGANRLCMCEPGTSAADGNKCVDSNCRIDDDCGKGGYCSPSYSEGCGTYGRYVGYYCRTPNDTCVKDSDCNDGKQTGLCVWEKEVKKWACSYNQCAG